MRNLFRRPDRLTSADKTALLVNAIDRASLRQSGQYDVTARAGGLVITYHYLRGRLSGVTYH